MIIACENSKCYSDYFYVEQDNLQSLKSYAENNIPLDCYKLQGRYKRNIYLIEEMLPVHLYLNNYLYYRNVTKYYWLIEKADLNKIYEKQCKKCKKKDYGWCGYVTTELFEQCNNYKQKITPVSILSNFVRMVKGEN